MMTSRSSLEARPLHLRRAAIALVVMGTLAVSAPVAAQTPPSSPAASPSPGKPAPAPAEAAAALSGEEKKQPTEADKEEARRQFKKGIELIGEQAWSPALAAFLRSRELYPTKNATINAAQCLNELQRYDDALAMNEALLREFQNLTPAEKLDAQRNIETLRERVGTIEVSGAEIGAAIIVDGQARSDYPMVTPLRVAAGNHLVRVYKEGFEPYETRVDVAGGQSSRIVAKLRAIKSSGRLRVTEQSGRMLEVVVDGVPRGQTPWEGNIEVGPHVVVLRGKNNAGSQPAAAIVKPQETSQLTLRAVPLDAALRVEAKPVGAQVAIDGVTVGKGLWVDRLPSGRHRVEVFEDGFIRQTREVTLAPGDLPRLNIELERDDRAERWQKPSKWTFELAAAAAIVPSFGGDVAGCDGACDKSLGAGPVGLVHASYELGMGLGFGLEAGYLAAWQSVRGRASSVVPVGLAPQAGIVDDGLRLTGFVAGATIAYRGGQRFPIGGRLGAGALLGQMQDERFGRFQGSVSGASGVTAVATARFFYIHPEVYAGVRLGAKFEVGASVGALVLVAITQPRFDSAKEFPGLTASDAGAGARASLASFPSDTLTGNVVVAIVPGLRARYDF
jgi:hypothetical protein